MRPLYSASPPYVQTTEAVHYQGSSVTGVFFRSTRYISLFTDSADMCFNTSLRITRPVVAEKNHNHERSNNYYYCCCCCYCNK